MATRATIRMYQMGFGDSFLVTLTKGTERWRMLVDCGVHGQSRDRPIEESVAGIIADLTDDDGTARVDVVVATHRHEDHIAGFADERWSEVEVGEVWLPWVEDESDELANKLREATSSSAVQLAAATAGADETRPELLAAAALAANSSTNDVAMARLKHERPEAGSPKLGFAGAHRISYLPAEGKPVIEGPWSGVRIHALGPARDPKRLRRMDPPSAKEWPPALAARARPADGVPGASGATIFGPEFSISDRDLHHDERYRAVRAHTSRRADLDRVLDSELLLAATLLERWCNNTSVFLVLEVDGRRLVFPGDAQEGAWEHVLADPVGRALLRDADFYKISHHGSHNGTPRDFVEQVWQKEATAMMPFGEVSSFPKIPMKSLLKALGDHHHLVVRSDQPEEVAANVAVAPDRTWSEITF